MCASAWSEEFVRCKQDHHVSIPITNDSAPMHDIAGKPINCHIKQTVAQLRPLGNMPAWNVYPTVLRHIAITKNWQRKCYLDIPACCFKLGPSPTVSNLRSYLFYSLGEVPWGYDKWSLEIDAISIIILDKSSNEVFPWYNHTFRMSIAAWLSCQATKNIDDKGDESLINQTRMFSYNGSRPNQSTIGLSSISSERA